MSKNVADTPVVTHWMKQVSIAAQSFESRWTSRALRRVDAVLAQAMREQIDLYQEACVTGSRADVEEHGAATVRGYQAITKAMIDAAEPDDAYMIGRDGKTGLVVAIGDQKACVERVREVVGQAAVWCSPDEVAALLAGIEGFKMIAAVKNRFPGAEIIERFPEEPAKNDGLVGDHTGGLDAVLEDA
jgi:hypothetical protein